ncbi:hypothetical protein ACIHFC_37110 [Streptomyces sp. NPDC052013]|uniref:hypothetical protein n=1 Tax=Streptomyces sp. NPDC052013 TaxID=3365679 RepID=UPI0037D485EE
MVDDQRNKQVVLQRHGSRVSERRGGRVEVLIDGVPEDVAVVHFELAVDRYLADGFVVSAQPAARYELGTPVDDTGYAFTFAALVGGWKGELIRAQAMRLWNDGPAEQEAEQAAIEQVTAQVALYDVLDDHLFLVPDGPTWHAYIDGHDVVSLIDGLATCPGLTPGRLGFDPQREPWRIDVLGRHRLRTLLADGRMSRLRSLRIRTWGGTAHLDPVLRAHDATDRLSHLCLWTQRSDLDEAPIAGRYPALRALECDADQLLGLLRDGAPRLHTLAVHAGGRSTQSLLDLLAKRALPALRHLALWHARVDPAALACSPVVAQLATLDVWTVNDATSFDFQALLQARPQLAHLQRIVVPGHLVPDATITQFRDWPQVTFTSFDRREVLALDLDTRGYTRDM